MSNALRITILTLGSRGDVQPYLALGIGLHNAGYHVTLAAPLTFAPLAHQYGLDFAPVRFNPQEFVALPEIQQTKGNIFRLILVARRIIGPLFTHVFDDFWAASQGADALLMSPAAHGAYDCADKLGAPLLVGWLQPVLPTRAFPCCGFPFRLSQMGAYNRLTYLLFEQILWQTTRPWLTAWRKRVLGLPPLPLAGPYVQMRIKHVPALLGYSPLVVPKPPDWPHWCHVTGYWFLEPPASWQPSDALERFLAAGPPPIAIGFGSMSHEQPAALTTAILSALRRTNQRAVLLSGWAGLAQQHLPDSVFRVEDIPHRWLFPRMRAIVHHGGAGTTGASLRAGVPSIVVPFGFDQFNWADRVDALGVGPRALPIRRLTAEQLADRIDQAVNDSAMRGKAARLGAQLQQEDGVGQAVTHIREYLQR